MKRAQNGRAENLSMRARDGGSQEGGDDDVGCQEGGEDSGTSRKSGKGRWGGNLAPCKARGGVRLRAVDPVLVALKADGKYCIHDYGCELIGIALSSRQEGGKRTPNADAIICSGAPGLVGHEVVGPSEEHQRAQEIDTTSLDHRHCGLESVCSVVPSLSARLSVCPPSVRSAPVFLSFLSSFIPSPPTHTAVAGRARGDDPWSSHCLSGSRSAVCPAFPFSSAVSSCVNVHPVGCHIARSLSVASMDCLGQQSQSPFK